MARQPYPSDLTDLEWEIIEPLLPAPTNRGKPRTTHMREVVNAILYILSEGCQWRALPHDFPPWSTVRNYFDKWKKKNIWRNLNKVFREKCSKYPWAKALTTNVHLFFSTYLLPNNNKQIFVSLV